MGRVIWMAQNPIFFFCVVFFPFIIGFLVTIPIPPRVSSVVISTLTLSYITAMLYVLLRRKPVIRVLFTEDGLVVHRGAGGFAVPRYVVVASNVVCITRSRWGLRLRIRYGSLDCSIPLSRIRYDRLINALATHWGWTPPQCPNISGPAS